MYYEEIDYNKLIIVKMEDLTTNYIKELFRSKQIIDSCGTVFIVDEEERYLGCVTRGDVVRAVHNNEDIRVNTNSKYVLDDRDKYDKIYEIEHNFKSIVIVPLLDKEHKHILKGIRLRAKYEMIRDDYFRWTDAVFINSYEFKNYIKVNNCKKVYVVGVDMAHMLCCGRLLKDNGIIDRVEYVCMDEKMIRAWISRTKEIVITYSEWLERPEEAYILTDVEMFDERAIDKEIAWVPVPELVDVLSKYGVGVRYISIPDSMKMEKEDPDIYFFENGFEIWAKAEEGTYKEKKEKYEHLKKDLLGVRLSKNDKGIVCVNDYTSKYVNFYGGCRIITETKRKNNIYILGPCIVVGTFCDDEHTVGSYLQDMTKDYNVVLLGGVQPSNFIGLLGQIKVKNGDIIYIISRQKYLKRYDVDMTEAFVRLYEQKGRFFYDQPMHCNNDGNKCVAEQIYQDLQTVRHSNAIGDIHDDQERWIEEYHSESDEYADNQELNIYKSFLKKEMVQIQGRIGAIVMNCNPFTKGHLYLIETAAEQVDFLYIFVVSENKSEICFEDRIELVKKGTAHINNVKVLPSGQFVLSVHTFSQYFEKEEIQDQVVDASQDVEIFAKHIAPVLNINVRFVGEEPLDLITKQYNQTLQRILPDYGIEVCVVPRKQINGEIVSASKVRKLIKEDKIQETKDLVPKYTYEYIVKKYGE